MKILTSFLFITLLIQPLTKAQDVSDLNAGFIIKYNSEILGEQREVYISIPVDFDPNKENKYPLVFLTESEFTFKPFSSIIHTMGEFDEIPKCIIVGLPLYNRHLEYAPILKDVPESGNAEKMLRFIYRELFFYIDSLYGIDYNKTILWTHSGMGGLFGVNTFLSSDKTFNGFIISSPNLKFAADYLNVDNPFKYIKQRKNVVMYLTCGSLEYENYQDSFKELTGKLNNDPITGLKWKLQVNEGRNHHTSAYAGLIDGLIFYFKKMK
jgi:predicted alpha/beta superfamily hydrolase